MWHKQKLIATIFLNNGGKCIKIDRIKLVTELAKHDMTQK